MLDDGSQYFLKEGCVWVRAGRTKYILVLSLLLKVDGITCRPKTSSPPK